MRYFDLTDDMLVSHRWHLSEVVTRTGHEPPLRSGIRYDGSTDGLRVRVGRVGRSLDDSMTSLAVPIARSTLGAAIALVAGSDVQRVPVEVPGHCDFEVLNSTRVLSCLDEARSNFVKWTEHDHRADLAGQVRMVTMLKVVSERVPQDAHFFRIEGWRIALIVSEEVKSAMMAAGCVGAQFVEVT